MHPTYRTGSVPVQTNKIALKILFRYIIIEYHKTTDALIRESLQRYISAVWLHANIIQLTLWDERNPLK